MAVSKDKIIKKAEKFLKSGKLAQAAEQYQILVDDNPSDINNLNKLGDIYIKMNKNAEGIGCYRKIAEHYAREGFILKAIAIYKKSTNADPSLLDIKLKLADLYSQQGLAMEAKSLYFAVAEKYAEEGMKDQSIDLYRKLLEIEPDNLQYRVKIADLYTEKKKIDEALREYRFVGDKLLSQNMIKEATRVFKKALELDSGNIEILSSLARTYSENNDYESAISLFEELLKKDPENVEVLSRLGNVYLKIGKYSEAENKFNSVIKIEPSRFEGLLELGRALIKKTDLERAWGNFSSVVDGCQNNGNIEESIKVLNEYLDVDSSNLNALEKLSVLCADCKDKRLANASLDKVAQSYIAIKMYSEASGILEALISAEPDNIQHQEKLEFVKAKLGGTASNDFEIQDIGIPEPVNQDAIDVAPAKAESSFDDRRNVKDFEKMMETDDEVISEYLTEAEVFVKYGLVTKAIDRLEVAKDSYPASIEIRSKLLEIYRDQGSKEECIAICVEMANIFSKRGNESAAREIIEDAKDIDPNSSLLNAYESGNSVDMDVEFEDEDEEVEFADSVEDVGEVIEKEVDAIDSDAEELEFEIDGVDGSDTPGVKDDHEEEQTGEDGIEFELEPVDQTVENELEIVDSDDAEAEVSSEKDSFDIEDLNDAEIEGSLEDEDFETIDFSDEEMDFETSLPEEENDFAAEIKQIESLVRKGMREEALAELTALALEHPASERVQSKLMELSSEDSYSEPAVSGNEGIFDLSSLADDEDIGNDFFDIGSELEEMSFEEEDGSDEPEEESLENIFNEFRQGIQEQFSEEDFETHYNLGIAYMEMGLTDEALTEFQVASKDPDRLLDCASMLGMGFMEKGMPAQAVNWFRKGLEISGLAEEDSLGLKYDLALALEANGEIEEALKFFEEVSMTDSDYREVSDRIQILKHTVMG